MVATSESTISLCTNVPRRNAGLFLDFAGRSHRNHQIFTMSYYYKANPRLQHIISYYTREDEPNDDITSLPSVRSHNACVKY